MFTLMLTRKSISEKIKTTDMKEVNVKWLKNEITFR